MRLPPRGVTGYKYKPPYRSDTYSRACEARTPCRVPNQLRVMAVIILTKISKH